MTKRTALCLVDTDEQARATVGQLTAAGFSQDDISVLFPDKGSTKEFAHQKETKLPEGATVGAGTGGVLGARSDSWPAWAPWPSRAWAPLLPPDP
jgi:hypothetical protein